YYDTKPTSKFKHLHIFIQMRTKIFTNFIIILFIFFHKRGIQLSKFILKFFVAFINHFNAPLNIKMILSIFILSLFSN
ncbi:hypothetical protein NTPn13_05120, partial [Streptococcus pneumoniae]